MNVGDLVIRAYQWPVFLSGIIVRESEERVECERNPGDDPWYYNQILFEVMWSDGSVTEEMYEELLELKEALCEAS